MPAELDRLHFVGSIPLSGSEDVFRQLSAQVGQFLRRMPDGETGERTLWIKFQQKMLFEHQAMERDPTHPPLPVKQADGTVHRHIQLLRLKPDADPDTIEFETGYDAAAAASYRVFRRLRDAHVVPAAYAPANRTADADGDRPHVRKSGGPRSLSPCLRTCSKLYATF
jgi:hypothetical protein